VPVLSCTAKRFPKLSKFSLLLLSSCVLAASGAAAQAIPSSPKQPAGNDIVLQWNAIALEAVTQDHSGTYGDPQNGGPTRASWALAIVHIAMYDALNAIDGSHEPYLPILSPTGNASIEAAVAQAAHDTLIALYPAQADYFTGKLQHALSRVPANRGRQEGIAVGTEAAANVLTARMADGANEGDLPIYPPTNNPPNPGEHLPDPINPGQGLLTPGWGQVDTFSGIDVTHPDVRTPSPPTLDSQAYADAFDDVLLLGGDGFITPTIRMEEETEIGLFWAYDGTNGLGVPPVLYNQIVRAIARQMQNTPAQNARLLALVNVALADAGIASWDSKYFYNLWRPVVGIRQADSDGNAETVNVDDWTPLGAPASNESGMDFTPPFPSYPSGHATFGGAMFRMLMNFYGTDNFSFRLKSDEMSGRTTDNVGRHRYAVVRDFDSFSQAAAENARSRIYLGIHWQFDADAGIDQGETIADYVFDTLLRPLP
jgi:membrane-associated phospholipid phosphatase